MRYQSFRWSIVPLFVLLIAVSAAQGQPFRPIIRPIEPVPVRPFELPPGRFEFGPRIGPRIGPEYNGGFHPIIPQESFRPWIPERFPINEGMGSFNHPPFSFEPPRVIRPDPIPSFAELSAQTLAGRVQPFDRQVVVQESLNYWARTAHLSPDPWAKALDLQGIEGRTQFFRPTERAQLEAVRMRVERELVLRGVDEITRFDVQKEPANIGKAVRDWLDRDAKTFTAENPARLTDHADVLKTLQDIKTLSGQSEGLEKLSASLKPNAKSENLKVLETIDRQTLPESIRKGVDGLEGLRDLQTALKDPGKGPPDVAHLNACLDHFEQALKQLPADPARVTLVDGLRQDLAMKSFLDGHASAAKELWPKNASPEHAAQLLRDVKALVTEKGEVASTPAAQVLPTSPASGGNGPRGPPPGLKALVPEGPNDGWRPMISRKATDGLEPLHQAAKQDEPLLDNVAKTLSQERTKLDGQINDNLNWLRNFRLQLQAQDEKVKKDVDNFEKTLTVPLQPAERVWIAQLISKKESAQAVADTLKKKRRDEEIERGLTVLKAYLAPKLDAKSIAELLKALSSRKVAFEYQQFEYNVEYNGGNNYREMEYELLEFTDTMAIHDTYCDGVGFTWFEENKENSVIGDGWVESRDRRLDVGDKIIGVAQGDANFVDTRKMSVRDAQKLFKGKLGTKLQLKVISRFNNVPTVMEWTRQKTKIDARHARLVDKAELKLAEMGQEQWKAWAERMLKDQLMPGQSGLENAERILIEAARQLLQQGDDVAAVIDLFKPVLSKDRVEVPGGLRNAVNLDMVALDLGSGLSAFEFPQTQALIEKGSKPAEVAETLRKQRQRERRKYDLERVKSYCDRPLTDKEVEIARQLLEEDKEVADVVAYPCLKAALSPEQQQLGGDGVREAVWLDEVRQALNPSPDAGEYAAARKMLREGKKSTEVAADLHARRTKSSEDVIQRSLGQVDARVSKEVNRQAGKKLEEWEREQALDMLRNGLSVDQVVERIQRFRKLHG